MIVTVAWIGLAEGLGVVVVVDTGTGVALMPLLLLWQVLHAEYGMVSCVTVLVVVTTAVGEPDGVAVALTATVAAGTGSASLAVSGVMMLNVWLAPSWTAPRLQLVGAMWHLTHLPLCTLGNEETSIAP